MEKYTQDMTPKLLFHRIWKRSLLIIFFSIFSGHMTQVGIWRSPWHMGVRECGLSCGLVFDLYTALWKYVKVQIKFGCIIFDMNFFLNIALRSIYFQFMQRILKRSCKIFYKGLHLNHIFVNTYGSLHLIVCLNGTFI